MLFKIFLLSQKIFKDKLIVDNFALLSTLAQNSSSMKKRRTWGTWTRKLACMKTDQTLGTWTRFLNAWRFLSGKRNPTRNSLPTVIKNILLGQKSYLNKIFEKSSRTEAKLTFLKAPISKQDQFVPIVLFFKVSFICYFTLICLGSKNKGTLLNS